MPCNIGRSANPSKYGRHTTFRSISLLSTSLLDMPHLSPTNTTLTSFESHGFRKKFSVWFIRIMSHNISFFLFSLTNANVSFDNRKHPFRLFAEIYVKFVFDSQLSEPNSSFSLSLFSTCKMGFFAFLTQRLIDCKWLSKGKAETSFREHRKWRASSLKCLRLWMLYTVNFSP